LPAHVPWVYTSRTRATPARLVSACTQHIHAYTLTPTRALRTAATHSRRAGSSRAFTRPTTRTTPALWFWFTFTHTCLVHTLYTHGLRTRFTHVFPHTPFCALHTPLVTHCRLPLCHRFGLRAPHTAVWFVAVHTRSPLLRSYWVWFTHTFAHAGCGFTRFTLHTHGYTHRAHTHRTPHCTPFALHAFTHGLPLHRTQHGYTRFGFTVWFGLRLVHAVYATVLAFTSHTRVAGYRGFAHTTRTHTTTLRALPHYTLLLPLHFFTHCGWFTRACHAHRVYGFTHVRALRSRVAHHVRVWFAHCAAAHTLPSHTRSWFYIPHRFSTHLLPHTHTHTHLHFWLPHGSLVYSTTHAFWFWFARFGLPVCGWFTRFTDTVHCTFTLHVYSSAPTLLRLRFTVTFTLPGCSRFGLVYVPHTVYTRCFLRTRLVYVRSLPLRCILVCTFPATHTHTFWFTAVCVYFGSLRALPHTRFRV